jgi:hypothetical protein
MGTDLKAYAHVRQIVSFSFRESADFRLSESETQIAVGRVCCDADGRLNQNSILLQVRAKRDAQ